MARRDVDQQISDLAAGDCLQVFDDGVDVPARDERRRRLDDRPGLAHELALDCAGAFRVNFVDAARVFSAIDRSCWSSSSDSCS